MRPRGIPASRQAASPTYAYDKAQPTRAAELEQALKDQMNLGRHGEARQDER